MNDLIIILCHYVKIKLCFVLFIAFSFYAKARSIGRQAIETVLEWETCNG